MAVSGLLNELQPMNSVSFREFVGKYVYIHCRDVLTKHVPKEKLKKDVTGVLAYGYIDQELGLCFQPVVFSSLRTNSMVSREFPEEMVYIFKFDSKDIYKEYEVDKRKMALMALNPEEHKFLAASKLDIKVSEFSEFSKMIEEGYKTTNADKIAMREEKRLDPFRHPWHPDNYRVIIYTKGFKPEEAWIRGHVILKNDKGEFQMFAGTLLVELEELAYNLHPGEIVGFIFVETENGDVLATNFCKLVPPDSQ